MSSRYSWLSRNAAGFGMVLLTTANLYFLTVNQDRASLLALISRYETQSNESACSGLPAVANLPLSNELSSPAAYGCPDSLYKSQQALFQKEVPHWGCVQIPDLLPFLSDHWNPVSKRIIFMNIGANKGYNQLEWLQVWLPQLGLGPHSWGKELERHYGKQNFTDLFLCGVCRDCRLRPAVSDAEPPLWLRSTESRVGIDMFAVEPNLANFGLLKHMKEWTNFSRLTLVNGAASNVSSIGKFPRTNLGVEKGSLQDSSSRQNNFVEVRIWTVDELISKYQIPHINFLKIDTEGHDALVVLGALRSFENRLITVIEFEYHGVGLWKSLNLEDVVRRLDGFGYDCYLEITSVQLKKMVPLLLTRCFAPEFEFRGWSNVLCHDRKFEELGNFLKSRSVPHL